MIEVNCKIKGSYPLALSAGWKWNTVYVWMNSVELLSLLACIQSPPKDNCSVILYFSFNKSQDQNQK